LRACVQAIGGTSGEFVVKARRVAARPHGLSHWLHNRLTAAGAAWALIVPVAFVALLAPAQQAKGDASPCGPSVNAIACENQQPGTPESVWDVSGAGDPTIQGFSTDISVNAGNTISFKIDTNAKAYTIDIYRLGYYGGDGARKVASISPSAALPQTQPACLTDPSVTLVDCGDWAVSASWAVPSTAVSGVYVAHLTRTDTGGASLISFIVRNDASTSDIVFQTSDETWEAYNRYGGANFYTGSQSNMWDSPSRARKLSYNRPFATRNDWNGRDFLFSNEYPTIRFLERNGYDVTYIAGVDTDRYGATLLQHHKVFMSVGHDEYWSGQQRANVTAARDAGVNLMFLSGNEVYWHTRFEPSIDGSNTPYRTLVCYKETWDNAPTDPTGTSTATWRDPRFGAAPGGSNPENALTGTMYMANSDDLAVTVTKAQAQDRLWRNTGLASMTGASTALAPHTVGYESDEDVDNGFRPAGLIDLSTTVGSTPQELQDFGNVVAAGTTTHHLTLYRAASGALVFGAGTIQWGWGLDADHDGNVDNTPADPRMQQATVNMLADMHAQPTTLMSGLVAAAASTDTTPPTSTITSPTAGQKIANGTKITVTGTAVDSGGGVVAGVEVSIDGGQSWHPATGTSTWSYTAVIHGDGAVTIQSRATDDSANVETPKAGVSVSVSCPCTLFGNTTPKNVDAGDPSAVELGVRFSSAMNGYIAGVRFYKSAANTGAHSGSLWTASGQQLATGTFTNETASGWQTLTFAQPVAITAGTTYVASYYAPNGHYSDDAPFFYYQPFAASPLSAQMNSPTTDATYNGVYTAGHGFPNSTYQGDNYYVDPVFADAASMPPTVAATTPANGAPGVATSVAPTATFSKAVTQSSIAFSLKDSAGNAVGGSVSYNSSTFTATFTPTAALASGVTYTASVTATDTSGNAMKAPVGWQFTTTHPCPCTLFLPNSAPTTADSGDGAAVNLGVQFVAGVNGYVTGVRFYKAAANTGTHSGTLWSAAGAQLATGTFANETASGWQTLTFAQPVAITAGATYVVSYFAPNGHYAADANFFATSYVDGVLTAPAGTNGVYVYGSGAAFPTQAYNSTNYWVDPIFATSVPDTTPPSVTATTPTTGATGVATSTTVSATFSEAVTSSSIAFTLTDAAGNVVPGAVVYNSTTFVATFTPSAALAPGTSYVAGVRATDTSGNAMKAPVSWRFTTAGAPSCPCTLFGASTPGTVDSGDPTPVNLGVSFSANVNGYVTGVRFYKSAANTGTHTGALWSSSGTQLATGTFANETASGWQTLTFASPVAVTAGTTYVASYYAPNGHYAADGSFFASPFTTGPLTAGGPANGVYVAASGGAFPTQTYNSTNYWVDPVFATSVPDTTPPSVTGSSPAPGSTGVATSTTVSATFSEAVNSSSLSFGVQASSGAVVAGSVAYNSSTFTATFTPSAALAAGTTYTVSVSAADTSGNAMQSPQTWQFTTAGSSGCPCTLFGSSTPANVDSGDANGVTVGVKFSAGTSGYVTGVRFYKSAANTGTHTGALWSSSGTQLATGTFANETASGWQTLTFASPVAVTAGTTYVAGYYAPKGHYSYNSAFFTTAFTNGPLTAAAGSNGVYLYGSSGAFPTQTYNSTNYWVDPVFATSVPDTTPPSVTGSSPAPGSTGVATSTTVSATFSEAVNSSSLSFGVQASSGAVVAGSVAYNSSTFTATFTPSAALAAGTTYTVSVSAADTSGNAMQSPQTWQFTTAGSSGCPCTLFGSSTPANVDSGDANGVTVGVKFSAGTSGYVTGVRFYKSAANTGTHTGALWSSSGTQLATGTFANETASGWQTLTFASPVAVTAGTTYVAGYYAPKGHYSYNSAFFTTAFTNGPLTAAAGSNGVYAYGSGATFPSSSYNSTNYWVDPVFAVSVAG
jgi:methionine-rich copper-binding protein CopC